MLSDADTVELETVETSACAFWRRIDRPGHDSSVLEPADDGWILTGFAVFDENGPTGLRYRVELAPDFSTRRAQIDGARSGVSFAHRFFRDRDQWHFDDRLVPGLGDLIHLDFGFTPATNLQQLRHAGLAVGDEAEIPAAWFDIGEESLVRLPQQYRRVAEDRYHYRSPTAGYEEVLEIASNGFVRIYPDLWEMEAQV